MQEQLQAQRLAWIETFRSRSKRDLKPTWYRSGDPDRLSLLHDPWGQIHRPDWFERGLLIWPRGGVWLQLEQEIIWPEDWREAKSSRLRLVLSWWADQVRLWVDGVLVHQGDLFDTTCRVELSESARAGASIKLLLELRSPCHDDGALMTSDLVLEPLEAGFDPDQALLAEALELHVEASGALPEVLLDLDPTTSEAAAAVQQYLAAALPPPGQIHWIGHAHLDLAWLWPVADTWQAAERTFRSALSLMKRFPQLRFSHSTPALYQWIEHHRPSLFAEIQAASRAGRWEPINGPWVETDCVLVSTASLWRQFTLGQHYSRNAFPDWSHELAWLPDSFGFASGLPAVAAHTGIRWFCTHKLAWNANNPFPHRLFRWCARGQAEVLALMLPPIGTGGDPLPMLREQRSWYGATGVEEAIWVPGVGDHGGGPTAEMLEQLQLWQNHPQALAQRPGTVRDYLASLEQHAGSLPVWRDELYLELHRGCATTRPDQKRHNRNLERWLREADLAAALLACYQVPAVEKESGKAFPLPDWRPLL
ncbi:MAG: alpha-mannosidase, partial [Prochlorococcus sp.]